jgi:hypothetical protein
LPPAVAGRALEHSRQSGEDGRAAVPTSTEDGDIIIRVEERDGIFLYVVTTTRGVDEFQTLTAEQAVAQALAFARRQHARAWFKGDKDPVLLEDFREAHRFRIDLS